MSMDMNLTKMMVYSGKKSPTSVKKKQAHEERVPKKKLINCLENKEWEIERKEYENKSL